MCIRIYVYMYVCMYVCMYECMYVCTCPLKNPFTCFPGSAGAAYGKRATYPVPLTYHEWQWFKCHGVQLNWV